MYYMGTNKFKIGDMIEHSCSAQIFKIDAINRHGGLSVSLLYKPSHTPSHRRCFYISPSSVLVNYRPVTGMGHILYGTI